MRQNFSEQFFCNAKAFSSTEKRDLALKAILNQQPITELAKNSGVSRKFIYSQKDKAIEALDSAFIVSDKDNDVLYTIPITRNFIQTSILSLSLNGHSSERGIVQHFRDIYDYDISEGTVHNTLAQVAQRAAKENKMADFGTGLRAGQAAVWPNLPCDADVFHVLMELGKIKTYLENRAIGAIAKTYELEKDALRLLKQSKNLSMALEKNVEKSRAGKISQGLALEDAIMSNQKHQNELNHSIEEARIAEKNIIKLVDTVETITDWMQHDILSVVGPTHAKRFDLFDFIVQVLIEAEKTCSSKHVRKMITKLKNQRKDLLRFVLRSDIKLAAVAEKLKIEASDLRELYELQAIPRENKYFWNQEQKLRKKIGTCFHLAIAKINEIIAETIRASSIIENINSRLRPYFFLRKSFGQESLELLRFYLNHKTFLRSEHPDRVGKSPAELLSGKAHSHWLEMLGFKLFKREVAFA